MAQVVGTAYVRLRLLTDSIGKDIDKAIARSDLQDIDVKVNADTGEADTELAATKALADDLDRQRPEVKVRADTKDARGEIKLLQDAIVLLGPTIGPLGAAGAAAFGLIAAGAGVALLAVQGVKKEMKDGTTVGVAFSGGIATLKADLSTLEATAARGVLPGFETTVHALNAALPGVNQSVGILSRTLGDMGGHVIVGLISGLQTFEPLLTHIALEADGAARHFEAWATGAGGAQFATQLGQQLDKIVPVLVHLVEAVGKLVAAFTPVGDHIVGVIGALAEAINAIPLPVLKVLATIFISLYTANRLIGIFTMMGTSLEKLGAGAAVANTSLGRTATAAASWAKTIGTFVAVIPIAYEIGKSLGKALAANDSLNASIDHSGAAYASFYNAVVLSNGAVDDGVKSAVGYQLEQDKLTSKAAKAGISQDQLSQAVTGTQQQYDALIATWRAGGKPADDTINALRILRMQYQNAYGPAADFAFQQKYAATLQPAVWGALNTTKDSISQVAEKYHLSTDAVTQYAATLGISNDAVKTGAITNAQLAAAVGTVSAAYSTATMAGSAFLAATDTFAKSAGTAADRAQYLGAYLKALQGDMLGYQGAVASGYAATLNLTNSFKQQADAVHSGTLAFHDSMKAAIDLKTGLIDVKAAGAAPLIQSLQQMQDAAMQAASATYQHEVATKGAGKAAEDAATIFKTQTYDALVKNADQLGLTAEQAKKLADKYFALPKDVKTKVAAIGTDPVIKVLDSIGKQLSFLTGKPWVSTLDANNTPAKKRIDDTQTRIDKMHQKAPPFLSTNPVPAQTKIAALQQQIDGIKQGRAPGLTANNKAGKDAIAALQRAINNLRGATVDVFVNYTSDALQRRGEHAGGGLITGPGGPRDDKVPIWASDKEYMIQAASVEKYGTGFLDAVNAGRYAGGGIVLRQPSPAVMRSTILNYTAGKAKHDLLATTVGGNLGAWIAQAIALTGVSPSWGPALGRRAMYESGGNPRAINLWDQNAAAGHPSKGLMQTIDSTFNAYKLPWRGNIWDPVDNMAAAINYILARYGSIFAIDPPTSGYKRGAWQIMRDQTARLHRGEMVVPEGPAAAIRAAAASGGSGDAASLLAEMRSWVAALATRPVYLVASNGGQELARVVNDANLANARRM